MKRSFTEDDTDEAFGSTPQKALRRALDQDASTVARPGQTSFHQRILPSGTILPVHALTDEALIMGHVTILDGPPIDVGGSAFIVKGELATQDGCENAIVALKVFVSALHDYQVSGVCNRALAVVTEHQGTLLRRELQTVRALDRHPNILHFIGTCEHHYPMLLSPYMKKGNLLKYLAANKEANRDSLVRPLGQWRIRLV